VADAWLANAGDGAIALATDRRIRRLAPEAAVLHAAYQSDAVGGHYPELRFVPQLAVLTGAVSSDRPECRGWRESDLSAIVGAADVVLSQGGGFLIEHYRPLQRLRSYGHVLDRGLPLAFTAQTVGRFEQEDSRATLSRAFRQAVAISVRDQRSVANVVDLGVDPERVRLAADEAFALFPDPPARRYEGRGVAVVLSRHTLRGSDRSVSEEPGLGRAIADIVRVVAEVADPEPLTIVSTNQGLGHLGRGLEDDREFAGEVADALPPTIREQVRLVDGYVPPLRFAELASRHRAIVSMRMHPVILGMSVGIPAVAVTSAHKTLDLLSDLDMDLIAAPWLDAEATADALRRALDPATPRGPDLWARLEPLRRRAGVSSVVVEDLLGAAESHA
jgi:polysaccharide pyruvyl transferase WcaK-like protein